MALRKKKAAKAKAAPRADTKVDMLSLASALCDRHHAGDPITRAECADLCAAADKHMPGWRVGSNVAHMAPGIGLALAIKAKAAEASS